MATVLKDNARNLPSPGFGGVPYGNLSALPFKFVTNASGVMADSDQATAVIVADKVILGVLPAGMLLKDAKIAISDAFTAATTFDLGFEYVDGVDVTAVPEDVDYFADAAVSSALAVLRMATTVAPVTLPKDAYLILTVAGAAHASAGQMDIDIVGVLTGNP